MLGEEVIKSMRQITYIFILIALVLCIQGCAPVTSYFRTRKSEQYLVQGAANLYERKVRSADAAFREAVKLRPAKDVYIRIGLSYHMEQYFAKAVSPLEKARSLGTQLPWTAQVALAAGYDASGQSERAKSLVRDAVAVMPDNAVLLNEIAYPMADAGVLLDDVVIILEKAVRLAPHEAYILDSLGWAYYKRGNLRDALRYLQEANRLMNNAESRWHLEQVMKAMENEQEGEPDERKTSV